MGHIDGQQIYEKRCSTSLTIRETMTFKPRETRVTGVKGSNPPKDSRGISFQGSPNHLLYLLWVQNNIMTIVQVLLWVFCLVFRGYFLWLGASAAPLIGHPIAVLDWTVMGCMVCGRTTGFHGDVHIAAPPLLQSESLEHNTLWDAM